MKKIKTVFVIDRELDCAIPEVNPEAKWAENSTHYLLTNLII